MEQNYEFDFMNHSHSSSVVNLAIHNILYIILNGLESIS